LLQASCEVEFVCVCILAPSLPIGAGGFAIVDDQRFDAC
jgi:hypothetical protein